MSAHPIPELSNNVSRYNPYQSVDRGLSRLNPQDPSDRSLFRVKSATWLGFGFNTAPGYLSFTLERFEEFPGVSEVIEGPGPGGTFDCATRTECVNPIMIEQFALKMYQDWYKGGGRVMEAEEIESYRTLGQRLVISEGKPYKLVSCESLIRFESEDGLNPIKPVSVDITYQAFFPKPALNPGDSTEELREYTFSVPPGEYAPLKNVRDHYNATRGLTSE